MVERISMEILTYPHFESQRIELSLKENGGVFNTAVLAKSTLVGGSKSVMSQS